jgi:phenylpropionate dioxygenase-like ring-hydroxylating dioxygenase large terminal subunit
MTTQQENERLTQVGLGTPMGALMRRYWTPACLAGELVAGGAPVRIALLGEKLIGFRSPDGTVGLLEHVCPHRCASLFLGRNEEGGLRCVYHGWKFDAEGKCVDAPNVPAEFRVSDRVRARAYPTLEQSGVIWAYMGEGEPPPPPAIEALLLDDSEVRVFASYRRCNYLQALEGEIDTSHFGFLHAGSVDADLVDLDDMHSLSVIDRAPRYHVTETDWGTMYGAYRVAPNDQTYWRVAHFLAPYWTMFPDGDFKHNIVANAAVPMDDANSMIFIWIHTDRSTGLRQLKDGTPIVGLHRDEDYLPNGTGWFERWRSVAQPDNDWLIDRDVQANESFSGLIGVLLQDQAVMESMGPIVDRSREFLTPSDHMVAVTRRRLLRMLKDHETSAEPPLSAAKPEVAHGARSGAYLAPAGQDWLKAYEEQLRNAKDPTGVHARRFAAAAQE